MLRYEIEYTECFIFLVMYFPIKIRRSRRRINDSDLNQCNMSILLYLLQFSSRMLLQHCSMPQGGKKEQIKQRNNILYKIYTIQTTYIPYNPYIHALQGAITFSSLLLPKDLLEIRVYLQGKFIYLELLLDGRKLEIGHDLKDFFEGFYS